MASRQEMSFITDEDCKLQDNAKLIFGDGADREVETAGDLTMAWDGTDFDVLAAADDSVIKFGTGTNSFDVWVFGETANDYLEWDASASKLKVVGDARLDFSSATVLAANTDGGLIKAGTSGAPVTEDTADMKFISLYFDNGATSGDNRGIYNRLYLTGAGGGGESLRTMTSVTDVAGGTAHGAHISLSFGSTGSITGLGVASRNTLHVPNQAQTGGTYAATQAEIYSDGSSSSVAGVTDIAFFRAVNGGDASGVADVDDKAYLIHLAGGSIAGGNVVAACNDTTASHGVRCKLAGTVLYLLANTTLA